MKKQFQFHSDLFSRIALIKASYVVTNRAHIHLDYDAPYYLVAISEKDGMDSIVLEQFENEMLAQNVRDEIYRQTKEVRAILLTRAMATSLVLRDANSNHSETINGQNA
ncbi:His-Xaa-Ser system protein HxsD [Ileibacterium valens]|uniref:His-Xaa-Ser system protein HxsD n=1 Tax=Ileibacterium valens TaxID=1862668 RepID=UPI003514A4FD